MQAYKILKVNRDTSPQDVKKAYKRALLENHPDKGSSVCYSIDEITLAYKQVVGEKELPNPDQVVNFSDTVDLDDFDYTEKPEIWTRRCRCGADGYVLTGDELDANGDSDEIAVQCSGCSIWILVQYALDDG